MTALELADRLRPGEVLVLDFAGEGYALRRERAGDTLEAVTLDEDEADALLAELERRQAGGRLAPGPRCSSWVVGRRPLGKLRRAFRSPPDAPG